MGFEKLLFQKIDLSVSLIFTSIVMNYDEGTKKNPEPNHSRAEPSIFALVVVQLTWGYVSLRGLIF